MKKITYCFVVLFGILGLLSGCQSTKIKDKQTNLKPKIVSTTVATTEIFDRLDLDLVGVPETKKTLPVRYKHTQVIGNPMSPDIEKISLLNPDQVYSTSTLESDLSKTFAQAKIPANFLDFRSIQGMMDAVTMLGKTYDRQTEAKKLNQIFIDTMKKVKDESQTHQPVRVLILMGIPGSYLVATEHSYIGNLVSLAGGVNIVKNEKAEYLPSNTEYLQNSNPDIILRAAHGMPKEVIDMYTEDFKTNPIWQTFSAVQNNRVYDLDSELFGMTADIHATQALEEMEHLLYGDKK